MGLQRNYNGITMELQLYYHGITIVLLWNYN